MHVSNSWRRGGGWYAPTLMPPAWGSMQDHEHLGSAGKVVQVRPGYMRHDLHPNKLAAYATPGNLRRLQQQVGVRCMSAAHNAGTCSVRPAV